METGQHEQVLPLFGEDHANRGNGLGAGRLLNEEMPQIKAMAQVRRRSDMKKIGLFLFTVVMVAGMAGCGSSYYSVKDPVGGGIYFTKEVEVVRGGAVKFTDGRSGATVTIQNSAVREITEQEFNVGVYTPEPAKPVPAPAPLQIQVVPPAPSSAPSPTAAPEVSPAPVEAPALVK